MGWFGLTIAALLGAANASEFFFRPPTGGNAVTLHGGHRQTFVKFHEDNHADQTLTGLSRLGIDYAFGLSERLAVGAKFSYSDLDVKEFGRSSSSGIEPLTLEIRGHEALSAANVIYGLDVGIGLEEGAVSRIGSVNRVIGDAAEGYNEALTVTPTIGVEETWGRSLFGLRARYDVWKVDTQFELVDPEGASKHGHLEGANRLGLQAYVEERLENFDLGAALEWIEQSTMRIRRNETDAHLSSHSMVRFDVLAKYDVDSMSSVGPTLTWYTTGFTDRRYTVHDSHVSVAYRRIF